MTRFCRVAILEKMHAAHHLTHHKGACQRAHGHTYQVEVTVHGPVKEDEASKAKGNFGMVIDFKELRKVFKEKIFDVFDHYDLNVSLAKECPYPSAENLALWIWEQLDGCLPDSEVDLDRVRVWEELDRSYAEVDQSCAELTDDYNAQPAHAKEV